MPSAQIETETPAAKECDVTPNIKASRDLPLPDLQIPVTFEDTRCSRSPKIVKASTVYCYGYWG